MTTSKPTPESASLVESLTDLSNILLLSPSRCTAKKNACLDLMSVEDPSDESMIGVMYPSPELFLDRIETELGVVPPETTVVSVTDDSSASMTDIPTIATDRGPTIADVDPDDATQVTELVEAYRDRLDDRESDAETVVLCFNSLTPLLEDIGRERTFQFLDSLTDALADANAVAHFHMDPDEHDSQTVLALTTLFDAVLESPDGEEWEKVYERRRGRRPVDD